MAETVGQRIKAARALHNDQKQWELAEDLTQITGEPWSRDMVASLERGRKAITVDIIQAIAKAHGRDTGYYLDGTTPNYAKGGSLSSLLPAVA